VCANSRANKGKEPDLSQFVFQTEYGHFSMPFLRSRGGVLKGVRRGQAVLAQRHRHGPKSRLDASPGVFTCEMCCKLCILVTPDTSLSGAKMKR